MGVQSVQQCLKRLLEKCPAPEVMGRFDAAVKDDAKVRYLFFQVGEGFNNKIRPGAGQGATGKENRTAALW